MGERMLRTITSIIVATTITTTSALANERCTKVELLLKLTNPEIEFSQTAHRNFNSSRQFNRLQHVQLIDDIRRNKDLTISESEDLYDLLGLSEDEYLKALSSGKTLKELLKESNKTYEYKKMLYDNQVLVLETALINDSITIEQYENLLEQYREFLESDSIFQDTTYENIKISKYDDPVLDMLDMSLQEYKLELLKGENLTTLLEKKGKTNEYKEYFSNDYRKIIENAVNSGSITVTEGKSLIEQIAA